MHPIVPFMFRVSEKDDVIPLSEPVVTKSGVTMNEIPVQKGQVINVAVHCYNR